MKSCDLEPIRWEYAPRLPSRPDRRDYSNVRAPPENHLLRFGPCVDPCAATRLEIPNSWRPITRLACQRSVRATASRALSFGGGLGGGAGGRSNRRKSSIHAARVPPSLRGRSGDGPAGIRGSKEAEDPLSELVFGLDERRSANALATGLVPSLSHPGGNLTGVSLLLTDTAGKRLEFLREIEPGLHTAAFLWLVQGPEHGQFRKANPDGGRRARRQAGGEADRWPGGDRSGRSPRRQARSCVAAASAAHATQRTDVCLENEKVTDYCCRAHCCYVSPRY